MASSSPQWLRWAREIQALAQNGLHYSENPYDLDRYKQLQAVATEILDQYSDTPLEAIQDLLQTQQGAMTPKVDVRGVVFNDNGEVLMVKELLDDGRWTLPGGWADPNEPPSIATVREIREESGYETRALKVLAVYDRDTQNHTPYVFSIYKLFFHCELIGGAPTTSMETGGVGWFAEDKLPQDLSLGRTTHQQLHRFFEHYRNPALPTDFD